MINRILSFWFGVFSEEGQGSWSRVGSGIALLGAIAWISIIVWRSNQIPSLEGIIFFIATLYGINKVPAVVGAFRGTTTPPPGK